jgi:DNA-binding transcriptional LysR family regulator
MDLDELRAFLTVVKTGSFLAAADSLGVSRTTLRRRVGSLEARAGVPLLESTRQGVVLTEAGQMLAARGRLMVQEASALLASIREVGHEPFGVLRVLMPVGLPPHLLTPLFAGLRAAYPRLRVHSRFSNDPLREPLVDIDMAVHFGEDTPKGPWLSHVIMRVREQLIASKDYVRLHGTPRSIDDLRRHELFAWQAPGEDARIWPTRKGTTFTVEPALIATDIHFIRHCCIAGLGIGFVPDAMVPDPGLPADMLVPVLPDIVGRERPVRVTVPEALSAIPKIRMVLDHVRRFLGER